MLSDNTQRILEYIHGVTLGIAAQSNSERIVKDCGHILAALNISMIYEGHDAIPMQLVNHMISGANVKTLQAAMDDMMEHEANICPT